MAKTEVKHLSMNPDTYTQGGLLSDVDVEVTEAAFTMYDYGGNSAEAPVLKMTLKNLEDESEEEQVWSCGAAKDFEPSEDGEYVVPTGSATGFRKSSNVAHFIASLVACAFPKDRLDAPASAFVGMRMHVTRKPAPEREGMEERQDNQGNKRKPTILVCTKIIKLPWEKGGKGATGKGAAAGAGTAGKGSTNTKGDGDAAADRAKAAGDSGNDLASTMLGELLTEHVGDGISVGDVKKLILKTKAEAKVKQAMIKMLDDADALLALDPSFALNGKDISIA